MNCKIFIIRDWTDFRGLALGYLNGRLESRTSSSFMFRPRLDLTREENAKGEAGTGQNFRTLFLRSESVNLIKEGGGV